MSYPELTICIVTYRRPWYSMLTLQSCLTNVHYSGPVKFHISDGGSDPKDYEYFKRCVPNSTLTIDVNSNPSDMINSCARNSGDVWIVALDDFCPRRPINVTPDVDLLMAREEIGCVRFSRLAFWGSGAGDAETSADLINHNGLHWWRIDKARTKDSYVCNIGFHLYHRRFWQQYGDIPKSKEHDMGNAEQIGSWRFREQKGCTIAVPMRFGQDSFEMQEPIWHLGTWRTDEYARVASSGRF